MIPHKSYDLAIQELHRRFTHGARKIHPLHWQGMDVSKKPEMATYELLHPSFSVEMTGYEGDMEAVNDHVKANLPWADDHFKERVCGQPINPGTEWANWPFGKSAARFLDETGRFNHNYMERYWPKKAGIEVATKVAADYEQALYDPEHPDRPVPTHRGIKYEYGDLSDVVELLASDPHTRQAYLPVWFPEDTGGGNKRAPCTLGYHFIMRQNHLDITYYIRSCDLRRHFRDDVYLTHALAAWVWQQCREKNPEVWRDVELGVFNMHITSLHVFMNDWRDMFPGVQPPT